MRITSLTRRQLLKSGAVAGAALAAPIHFVRGAYAQQTSCNSPTGDSVTFGWNVPLTGA